jgi:HlyD family secretion protein
VNEGEIAIIGMQNQPGTTLMTIATCVVITAEVKVDETDIVNVHISQEAKSRSTRWATKNSKAMSPMLATAPSITGGNRGTQEAKDFKVVITLDEPRVRPGSLHPISRQEPSRC